MAKCIITGCDLLIHHAWTHGDLFDTGAAYVFNAVVANGETRWLEGDHGERYLEILEDTDFFERRGVFVIPKMGSRLSQSAKEYVCG